MATSEEVLTAEEAAQYLRIHAETLRRKVREGEIPAVKVGRAYRFRKEDLERWLSFGSVLPTAGQREQWRNPSMPKRDHLRAIELSFLTPRVQSWADELIGRHLTETELEQLQNHVRERFGATMKSEIYAFIAEQGGDRPS